jgi:ribulose bisphosphate carboxylase small subunit
MMAFREFSETKEGKKIIERIKQNILIFSIPLIWDEDIAKLVESGLNEGFKAGQESREHDDVTIRELEQRDKIVVKQARQDALEEIENSLLKWTQLHPAQLGQITKGIEVLKKEGERK